MSRHISLRFQAKAQPVRSRVPTGHVTQTTCQRDFFLIFNTIDFRISMSVSRCVKISDRHAGGTHPRMPVISHYSTLYQWVVILAEWDGGVDRFRGCGRGLAKRQCHSVARRFWRSSRWTGANVCRQVYVVANKLSFIKFCRVHWANMTMMSPRGGGSPSAVSRYRSARHVRYLADRVRTRERSVRVAPGDSLTSTPVSLYPTPPGWRGARVAKGDGL